MRRLPPRPRWDLPGASFGRALRVFAADYPNAMRLRWRRHPRPDWDAGHLAPVVLIPGVYEPWWYLAPIGERLHDRGHPVVPVPTLRTNTRPVLASAETVARVLAERDLRGVVLVTHSKGGLVGKRLMLDPAAGPRIDRMVAIAAPFGGSVMASYVRARALRVVRPTDADLIALRENREVDSRITSVFPVFDPHIPEGSRLEGARNVPLRMGGHFGVLVRPDAVAAVVREVGRPE